MSLTQPMADCLAALVSLTTPAGVAPSYTELSAYLGHSRGHIHKVVQLLSERGYVAVGNGRRDISVLTPPTAYSLGAMSDEALERIAATLRDLQHCRLVQRAQGVEVA